MEANEKLVQLHRDKHDEWQIAYSYDKRTLGQVHALITADVAMAYRKFVADGDWIESTNDLWYQKSDGNPSEGIAEDQLFAEFMNQYKPL